MLAVNEPTPRRTRANASSLRAIAERMAAAAGAAGLTNAALQKESGRDGSDVASMLARLTHDGKLFAGKVQGHPKRWFTSAELALAWVGSTKRKNPGPERRQMFVINKPAAPAPVVLKPNGRSGDPIITARTKITRDTRQWPTARWQLRQEAPDERWPRFAASRPGINPETGRAWGDPA